MQKEWMAICYLYLISDTKNPLAFGEYSNILSTNTYSSKSHINRLLSDLVARRYLVFQYKNKKNEKYYSVDEQKLLSLIEKNPVYELVFKVIESQYTIMLR
jgi:hypothetical protein